MLLYWLPEPVVWYGCHTKRHGKHAGHLWPLCTFRKSVSPDSPDRKFICGFYQQLVITFLSIFCNWEDNENVLEKLKKKATEKHNYDLTYDNVAIPEVHTHKPEDHEETPGEDAPVHYDNVAIPEVHIRRKK